MVKGLATREASVSFFILTNREFQCNSNGKIKNAAKRSLCLKKAFVSSHKKYMVNQGLCCILCPVMLWNLYTGILIHNSLMTPLVWIFIEKRGLHDTMEGI